MNARAKLPWLCDSNSCPGIPVRPCASDEAIRSALPPSCVDMAPTGRSSLKTKKKLSAQALNFADMQRSLVSGKLSREKFFQDAHRLLSSGRLTTEEKAVLKQMMKADISRRMEEVMEAARRDGSELVGSSLHLRDFGPNVVMGDDSMMTSGIHGSSKVPLQNNLRWNCDRNVANNICNFNRKHAEPSGYFATVAFLEEAAKCEQQGHMLHFYDSNSGHLLFTAPQRRDFAAFLSECEAHGWPSFRDDEVNWDVVRVLPDGETISTTGTHLGHNLPDNHGNRYCINLVSVAGHPK